MLRKKHERASNTERPKNSAFRLRDKEVTGKVERYIKEHPMRSFGANVDWNIDGNMVSARTIPAMPILTKITDHL
jgi:hypothetical protein